MRERKKVKKGYEYRLHPVDLLFMLDSGKGNQYLLMAEDSFSRYCCAYPIPKQGSTHRSQGVDGPAFQCIWVTRPVKLRQWQRICKQFVERIVLRIQDTTYYNSAI